MVSLPSSVAGVPGHIQAEIQEEDGTGTSTREYETSKNNQQLEGVRICLASSRALPLIYQVTSHPLTSTSGSTAASSSCLLVLATSLHLNIMCVGATKDASLPRDGTVSR